MSQDNTIPTEPDPPGRKTEEIANSVGTISFGYVQKAGQYAVLLPDQVPDVPSTDVPLSCDADIDAFDFLGDDVRERNRSQEIGENAHGNDLSYHPLLLLLYYIGIRKSIRNMGNVPELFN